MRIETLIYIYGAVCLCMLGFNILYAIQLKEREPNIQKRYNALNEAVSEQLKRLSNGEKVSAGHYAYLEKKLKKVKNLVAFDRLISDMIKAEIPQIRCYLQGIEPVLQWLAQVYLKQEDMISAYFAYFISDCVAPQHISADELQEILLEYIKKKSLYCRVNALHTLMKFGSPEYVLKAVLQQDNEEVYLHNKILTESLLNFDGDYIPLIDALLENWDAFSVRTQLGIANYIRFRTAKYSGFMRSLMNDEKEDKELRLAAIRYFGRYPDETVRDTLIEFAGSTVPAMWQYATVSLHMMARR